MSFPVGMPLWFNLDTYFSLIDMYIASDEVETALYLLDNPPAYFKDNPPQRLIETREALHRQLWTPIEYKGIYEGVEGDYWPHRAEVLENVIKAKPGPYHIMELAPGSRFIQKGLEKKQYPFTYEWRSLDECVGAVPMPSSLNVFVCFELIEHLSNPAEIYQGYLKFGKKADIIAISTPLYTYGGGMGFEWRNRPLGHLKTFTPSELHTIVAGLFLGFTWTCHLSDTITLIGERTGT